MRGWSAAQADEPANKPPADAAAPAAPQPRPAPATPGDDQLADTAGAPADDDRDPSSSTDLRLGVLGETKPAIDVQAQHCMALAMYWEARGESQRGMQAVGSLDLNYMSRRPPSQSN